MHQDSKIHPLEAFIAPNSFARTVAFKLEKLLQSNELFHPDLIIAAPQQTVPHLFDSYMKHVMNVNSIIGIPSSVIDKIAGKTVVEVTGILGEEEIRSSDWAREIERVTNVGHVIFDEFHVSGGTYQAISSILRHFNRRVLCYLPLVDFDPRRSSTYSVPTLSLYRIQNYLPRS